MCDGVNEGRLHLHLGLGLSLSKGVGVGHHFSALLLLALKKQVVLGLIRVNGLLPAISPSTIHTTVSTPELLVFISLVSGVDHVSRFEFEFSTDDNSECITSEGLFDEVQTSTHTPFVNLMA